MIASYKSLLLRLPIIYFACLVTFTLLAIHFLNSMDAPHIDFLARSWYAFLHITLPLGIPLGVVGLLRILQADLPQSTQILRYVSVLFLIPLLIYYYRVFMDHPSQYWGVNNFTSVPAMIAGLTLSVECALRFHKKYPVVVQCLLTLVCVASLLMYLVT